MALRRILLPSLCCLALLGACTDDGGDELGMSSESSGDGDGDDSTTDPSGDGDGDDSTTDPSGDGDGDATTDPSTGDGDGDATTDPSTGDGDGDAPPDCTGPLTTAPLPPEFEQPADPKMPGSTWAYFELEDFQPQSCNFGQTTSLEAFKGRVTLVTLMRSTCEICQGTIEKLEEMQIQLGLEGHEVYMVAINQMGYEDSQQEFIDRATFPLLQDVAEVDAWDLMNEPGLGTDDMYIYDADGQLTAYYNYADADPNIDLNTSDGWDVIYNALLEALGQ